MSIFFRRQRRKSDYFQVQAYRPAPYRRSRVRGADYLYLVICGLVVFGIFQRIEISKLQRTSKAAVNVLANSISITPPKKPEVKVIYQEKKDERITRLEKYLNHYGSPLAEFAELIVKESDKNGIDWTIITSIAGNESTFGKNCKLSCHNPFGLGGTKPLCFSSWEEAIVYQASLLNTSYRINMANGIQSKYCPPEECNPEWSRNIVYFTKEILAQ